MSADSDELIKYGAGKAWRERVLRQKVRREIRSMGVHKAMQMTPEQARQKLAEWAAKKGRTQAEVDAMNRQSDVPAKR